MQILRHPEHLAAIRDAPLRQLIEQRIQGCCPWDAEELGPILIIEPGDTALDLETIMGFSVLESLFDESRFGDEDFAPSFEFAEAIGEDLFELVYILSDSGYGYDLFIPNQAGIDPVLLAFCQTYAVPTP